MTRPGGIPVQAGIEPRIFRCRGGRLNHYANEAVRNREGFKYRERLKYGEGVKYGEGMKYGEGVKYGEGGSMERGEVWRGVKYG